jgi:hypothetical protein
MTTDPLQPQEVDAILRPDPRTTTADLLVLRDALQRMGDAFERLADAVVQLHQTVADVQRFEGSADAEVPRPMGPPPRAD